MLKTYQAGAGSQTEFHEKADFFRLMNAAYTVDVYFYHQGQEVARAEGVSGGYAETFTEPFDRIAIISASEQQIQFVTRYGNVVSYDQPPQGLVIVSNVNGAFTQSTKTNLTSVAQDLLAAKPSRRYLLVQNNDSGLSMRVKVDGSAATATDGILIGPGGSLELQGYVPTGKVSAICTTAGTLASVEIVEG